MRKLLRNISGFYPKVLKAFGITLLAFALSMIMIQPLSFSAATLLSTHERNDFNMTDFYNLVADSRHVRTLDEEIVVIDIADTDREDITLLLEGIAECQPAAVGLDVMFPRKRSGDDRLIEAIRSCPNLVMVVDVDAENGKFTRGDVSYFYDSVPDLSHGVSNLRTKFAGGTVRKFQVEYPLAEGDTLDSFPVAVAKVYSPEKYGILAGRGNEAEIINFPSRTFRVYDWDDFEAYSGKIKNRIVMIGDLKSTDDMHRTPVVGDMSGILIHSYALSTILYSDYYHEVSKPVNTLIAFMLCFFMLIVTFILPPDFKGIAMRIIQVGILYMIIRIGYWLFVDHDMIVDFSMSLLMLTFGLFASDIWHGIQNIINYISKKLKKTNQSYETVS